MLTCIAADYIILPVNQYIFRFANMLGIADAFYRINAAPVRENNPDLSTVIGQGTPMKNFSAFDAGFPLMLYGDTVSTLFSAVKNNAVQLQPKWLRVQLLNILNTTKELGANSDWDRPSRMLFSDNFNLMSTRTAQMTPEVSEDIFSRLLRLFQALKRGETEEDLAGLAEPTPARGKTIRLSIPFFGSEVQGQYTFPVAGSSALVPRELLIGITGRQMIKMYNNK
jgi:hypothetical protein